MKNGQNNPMKVMFYKKSNPKITYSGIVLFEDGESITIGINFQGTLATIVCFYDEWQITKIY